MKKIIIGVVLILVIGAAAMFAFSKYFSKSTNQVSELLPADALIYTDFSQTQEVIEQIKYSPIWQALTSIDYSDMLLFKDQSPQMRIIYETLSKQFQDPQTQQALSMFFGKEVALAVYKPNLDLRGVSTKDVAAMMRVAEDVLSNIYLVTRVGKDVQLAELLSRSSGAYGDVTTTTVPYEGYTYQLISVPNVPVKFAFVRVGDLIVMGVGESSVKRIVDVANDPSKSLAKDPEFVRASSEFIPDRVLSGYWNMGLSFAFLEEQANSLYRFMSPTSESAAIRDQIQNSFEKFKGFKNLGYSFAMADISKFVFQMFFDLNEMDTSMSRYYADCQSAENHSLKMVPQEALFYQWASCMNLSYYWEQMKGEAANTQTQEAQISFQAQVDAFEAASGLSIERDLLPAFGDEIGGFLEDLSLIGLFPIPRFILFIEVADQMKVEKILALAQNQPMVAFQNESYQGSDIKFVATPLGADVQPGYTYLDKYLLVSNSKDLIKKSIDVHKSSRGALTATQPYKDATQSMGKEITGLQFIRVQKFLQKLNTLIDWSQQWMSKKEQQKQAFQSGSELRLQEVKEEIKTLEQDLDRHYQQVKVIEDEIWNLNSQGLDKTAKEREMEDLRLTIEAKQADFLAAEEELRQLSTIVDSYNSGVTSQQRQKFFDEILKPFLKAFESIEAVGSYSTMDQEKLKSTTQFKMGM